MTIGAVMTALSRRTFVTGAAATAAAVVGSLGVGATVAASRGARPTTLTALAAAHRGGLRAVFTAAVGSSFRAVAHGASHVLRLVSVDDLPGAVGAAEAFRLAFDGTVSADGIHTLSAANVAPVDLYIGLVGPAHDRGVEAVIDRRSPRRPA